MASMLGARKDTVIKAVSTAPSFNKTPVGSSTPPLPYPTVATLDNSTATVPTVRLNGKPAYVLNQTTQPSCKGDSPGVAKGVKSGTVSGEVKPGRGSSTVRVGGKPVIRAGDPCTMNGGNNPGVYVAVAAMAGMAPKLAGTTGAPTRAQTQEERGFLEESLASVKAKAKELAQDYKDKVSAPLHQFAGDAMDKGGTIATAGGGTMAVGGGMVASGVLAAPGGLLVAGGGATAAVGGGVSAAGGAVETGATALDAAAEFMLTGKTPDALALGMAYAERMVMSKLDKITRLLPGKKRKAKDQGKKEESAKKSKPESSGGGGDGFHVQGTGSGGDSGCGIKPYKDQKCPAGQQAHHIVPDYALRYGSRGKGAKGQDRIPGMPSLADGPSICLGGGSKTPGSEHNQAHEGTDPRVAAAGKRTDNGPLGTAPLGEIVDISIEEVSKVKPHCGDEIKQKVGEAFKGVDRSQYGRTTQQPPAKDSQARATLERGESHQAGNRGRKKR